MISPHAGPEQAATPIRDRLLPEQSLLPEQGPGDTDAAWGDYPAPAEDRLRRDRPPHWADF